MYHSKDKLRMYIYTYRKNWLAIESIVEISKTVPFGPWLTTSNPWVCVSSLPCSVLSRTNCG